MEFVLFVFIYLSIHVSFRWFERCVLELMVRWGMLRASTCSVWECYRQACGSFGNDTGKRVVRLGMLQASSWSVWECYGQARGPFGNVMGKIVVRFSTSIGSTAAEVSLGNGLTWLTTKLQKKKGKLWINTYANNAKNETDYVLMNKKWINSILNCEAYYF